MYTGSETEGFGCSPLKTWLMTVSANVTSSSLVSFFLLMACVTTNAGYRPEIFFSTGSGDFYELGI